MTKTLIDIDDELLDEAKRTLGTSSKKDTVAKALARISAQLVRRKTAERPVSGVGVDALTRKGFCLRPADHWLWLSGC